MCLTSTGRSVSERVEGLRSVSDSISQHAAALEAPGEVCAPSSVSTHTHHAALIHICTGKGTQAHHRLEAGLGWSRPQRRLTLTVGPVVGDEDGHAVGGAVAAQAGAVEAAVGVVADGARTADFIRLDLTFIFICRTELIKTSLKSS